MKLHLLSGLMLSGTLVAITSCAHSRNLQQLSTFRGSEIQTITETYRVTALNGTPIAILPAAPVLPSDAPSDAPSSPTSTPPAQILIQHSATIGTKIADTIQHEELQVSAPIAAPAPFASPVPVFIWCLALFLILLVASFVSRRRS